MAPDLSVPALSAWPIAARIPVLALLALFVLVGATAIADASGSWVVVPIAPAVWAALAAYAWGPVPMGLRRVRAGAVRRPHVGLRAVLIVAAWFAAVVLSFI